MKHQFFFSERISEKKSVDFSKGFKEGIQKKRKDSQKILWIIPQSIFSRIIQRIPREMYVEIIEKCLKNATFNLKILWANSRWITSRIFEGITGVISKNIYEENFQSTTTKKLCKNPKMNFRGKSEKFLYEF